MFLSLSLGLEHYLFVCFIIGYFIAPIWYKGLQLCLAPLAKCKCESDDKNHTKSVQDLTPPGPTPNSLVISIAIHLPSELRGRIASYCGFRGVAAVGGTCRALQAHIWESKEVWHALATSTGLGDCCSNCKEGWQARAVFRRAVFRIDLSHLQVLAAKGRSQAVLDELVHFACGLMHGDLTDSDFDEFLRIATRALSAHDPANALATTAAERLLRATNRAMDLYTEEQLERLEYAYKSVHQLHALMMASMQDSYEDMLEDPFWSHSEVSRRIISDGEASDDLGESESSDSRSSDDIPKENLIVSD